MPTKYYPKEFINMLKILSTLSFDNWLAIVHPGAATTVPFATRPADYIKEYDMMKDDVFEWVRAKSVLPGFDRILNEANKLYVIQLLGKD